MRYIHYIVVNDDDGTIHDPAIKDRITLDGYSVVDIIGCMDNYYIGRDVRIG